MVMGATASSVTMRKAQLQLLSFRGNELDKENIWKYFEDREAKELAIRLRDVRDGVYQMKTYSINEKTEVFWISGRRWNTKVN